MARQRSDPRRAARHTGDVWQRGYELRTDRNFTVDFGPFTGVAHHAAAGQELQFLRALEGGVIHAGVIFPAWAAESNTDLPSRTYTWYPRLFHVDGERYLFIPGRLSSGNLVISDYDSSLNQTDYDTGLSIGHGDPMDFTAYGNNLYIVYGSGDVVEYDVSAGTDSNIASSPQAGEFIFVLDNNVVVIYQNSGVWEAAWSVDGSTSDFSSIGSGTAPIKKEIGNVLWHVSLPGSHLIVGEHGAVRMIPTGTLPAFRFRLEPTFPGIADKFCAASYGPHVFYLGRDYQPYIWRGGTTQLIGGGSFSIDFTRPAVCIAPEFAAVTFGGDFGLSDPRIVFFSLEEPHDAIAEFHDASAGTNYAFVASSPSTSTRAIKLFEYGASGGPESLTLPLPTIGSAAVDPVIETHAVHLGHRVQVSKIEVLWSKGVEQAIDPQQHIVELTYDEGSTTTTATATFREGSTERMIYDLTVMCDNFSVKVYETEDLWTAGVGVKQIKVYCTVAAQDDTEVL